MKFEVANLDHWEEIKRLCDLIQESEAPFYEKARQVLDVDHRTMEAYLATSLVDRSFHFWVVSSEADSISAFIFFQVGAARNYKSPKTGPVPAGFIITVFSNSPSASGLLKGKLLDFALENGLKYYHGNVKVNGAHPHFLEHFGATESSRALHLEVEKLNGK